MDDIVLQMLLTSISRGLTVEFTLMGLYCILLHHCHKKDEKLKNSNVALIDMKNMSSADSFDTFLSFILLNFI